MESLLETQIGAWCLKGLIASGGMAAVFDAHHVTTGQLAAVKVLKRDLRKSVDPFARLVQEGRVICSLLHEHIVRVFDYGTAEESIAFIAMERLYGRTIAELIHQERTIEPLRAAFIARQLCEGLSAAHARGIFHRDIKPANIFVVDDQRHRDFVKLVDFGIAKLDATDPSKLAATATGMTLGTPEYMSPEQVMAAEIDGRSDVYQVGVVLFEMLTGDVPFTGHSPVRIMQAQLTSAPPMVRRIRADVPEELERIIARCLAKEPEGRFATILDLAKALDDLSERDTSNEGLRIVGDDITATSVGNLRIPALGNRGDLNRYARNLAASIESVWPKGTAPEDVKCIQDAISELGEEQGTLRLELAERRADADDLARSLESRLTPIERAIHTLTEDRSTLEGRLRICQDKGNRGEDLVRTLDSEFAAVYEELEQHQQALFHAAHSGARAVDFRELFREDIDHELGRLEHIYAQRSEQADPLNALREEAVHFMRLVSDLQAQITQLEISRLHLEGERTTRLAEREFLRADAEMRHRALERALEYHHLRLGLAFRMAVARLV